jgi:hypothetical protein
VSRRLDHPLTRRKADEPGYDARGAGRRNEGDGRSAGAASARDLLRARPPLITGATGEELGWRGFALPYLQTRMNALAASVVPGALWGVWHLPLWFTGFGWEQQSFWLFTLNCISFSIVATWVCNSTDARLVIVTLMHLFYNFGAFVSTDAVLIPAARALPYRSALLGVFAVAVVVINGPATLSRGRRAPVNALDGSWQYGRPPAPAAAHATAGRGRASEPWRGRH